MLLPVISDLDCQAVQLLSQSCQPSRRLVLTVLTPAIQVCQRTFELGRSLPAVAYALLDETSCAATQISAQDSRLCAVGTMR